MLSFEQFLHLDIITAVQVALLGFVGGLLSGFMGTGGAFFMTPGMMNLGVPGALAVGSNIAHKLGKSLVGSATHAKMGHVDRKLGLFMLATALVGVQLAAMVNKSFYPGGGGSSQVKFDSPAGDLYISVIFVVVLSIISIWMLHDFVKSRKPDQIPDTRMAEFLSRFRLAPMISFPISDIRVSLWLLAIVGLMIGFLAGSVGIGGFLGVPAMIYVFGVPTVVAAGTEMFLAIFMGAWGTITYAWGGFIDLRLTFLLYLGSLLGIYIGAYGTKIVREEFLRLVTGGVILICVLSRAINIPVYLGKLGYLSISDSLAHLLQLLSKLTLFASGIFGVAVILIVIIQARAKRRKAAKLLRSFGV